MLRLAVLVPRPRVHLIRFHGVVDPHAKLEIAVLAAAVQEAPNPQQSTRTARIYF